LIHWPFKTNKIMTNKTRNFNYFKILEKDNKELTHSAFISYLLDNNRNFRKLFVEENDWQSSKLEQSYSHNKKRCRIDIELRSNDENTILFIENKFKSFPEEEQLSKYDEIFKQKFNKDVKLIKILFCFDKKLVSFDNQWKIFDYQDLLKFLKINIDNYSDSDEKTFIEHYILFLEEYVESYRNLEKNCKHLFNKVLTKKDKFWLKLLNSKIALEFKNNVKGDFKYVINPGNTSTPLLNIIPKKWNEIIGEEVLIQFQGNSLSFYLHSANKNSAEKIIEFSKSKIWSNKVKLKKITKRKEKSCFIFKTLITDNLNDDFTLNDVYKFLVVFYGNIDNKIIKNYAEITDGNP